MVLANFLDDAVNIAAGIILAAIFILMMLAVFSDMIFGLLGSIRRSWNENMRDK